jgi:cell division protein FtsN
LFQNKGNATASAGGSTRLVERDVEAPEVFQASESGLWDGRPSLGGVWVAHPDVTEPERALIRNTANNKFVIGALFKPSVERSGPRFQVSSDAADALGMLAGQPVNLNVTALRREEVPTAPATPTPAAAPAAAETAAAAMPAPEAVETATLDPVDGATAALDRAEAETLAEAPAETAAPVDERPKKRRWFWQKKDSVPDTSAQIAAETAEAATPAPVAAAPVSAAPPTPAPAPVSTLDKPYIQIGIFSVEQNARNTAVAMRQSGMIPEVLKQSSKGKTFWRVVVGPATTTNERAALLKKIKAAGFTDAYAVTN